MAKIGCVPYLNARPLLEGLECRITELVPARLCEEFQKGEFDAALLSSIDVLSQSDASVVDGVAIASRGEVHSVILAYTGEVAALGKIHLDPSSHTSNALLRIILEEFHALKPEYIHTSAKGTSVLPRLLIGDPAIAFRKQYAASEFKILDLGEEWYLHTGLPFVFALWVLKEDITQKKILADVLRSAKNHGLSRLAEIADRTMDPDFSLRYLTSSISYDLGEEEKRGLELFGNLLVKYDLIDKSSHRINFL